MKIRITIFLFMLAYTNLNGQQSDERIWYASFTASIVPVKLQVVDNVAGDMETIIDNYFVDDCPEYQTVNRYVFLMGMSGGIGYRMPLKIEEFWSLGTKLQANIGILLNVKGADGIQSRMLEFPEFVYYRNCKNRLDYSILFGYKYTLKMLPTHYMLVGCELFFNDYSTLAIYGTVNRYSYYTKYTNGILVPSVGFREYGLTYSYLF